MYFSSISNSFHSEYSTVTPFKCKIMVCLDVGKGFRRGMAKSCPHDPGRSNYRIYSFQVVFDSTVDSLKANSNLSYASGW